MTNISPLSALAGAEFALLTTFRMSGVPVATPVWFAEADGKLYVTTQAQAGKVKRIRANGRATAAPSDRMGNPSGPAVELRGRELPLAEHQRAVDALRGKYGPQYDAVTGQMGNASRTFIELEAEVGG